MLVIIISHHAKKTKVFAEPQGFTDLRFCSLRR